MADMLSRYHDIAEALSETRKTHDKERRIPHQACTYIYRIDEDKTKVEGSSEGDKFICPAVMGRDGGSMQVPDGVDVKALQEYHRGIGN
jgi:hypothetical protein